MAAYPGGDSATAISELRSFAEQGNAEAQYNLGYMYGEGLGVPQDDYVQAHMWLNIAASSFPPGKDRVRL